MSSLLVVSAANIYSKHSDFLHRAETPQPRELREGENAHTHARTHMHTHTCTAYQYPGKSPNKAQPVNYTDFHVALIVVAEQLVQKMAPTSVVLQYFELLTINWLGVK